MLTSTTSWPFKAFAKPGCSLRSLRFRQIVWIVVLVIGCWMLPAFSERVPLKVLAETLPPDVNYYQLRRTAANVKAFSNQTPSDSYLENAKQSYQNTADKIREGKIKQLLPNAQNNVYLEENHDDDSLKNEISGKY